MTTQAATSELPQTIALDEVKRRAYEEAGYLILRGFFPREVVEEAAAEGETARGRAELVSTDNIRCRWSDHCDTGQCQFDAFDPIADLAPACGGIATDPRLLAIVSALYSEEACLFKDKLIYKPPGAKGYGLHQDYISWPAFPKSFLTVLVPLDPCDAENGCTEVFTGYHQAGYLSPVDGDYHELRVDTVDPARAVPLVLDVGDIAIFGGFTPHRSAPNRSDRWRRQLYLSYNAHSDGGHQRERHYKEFHAWLVEKYAQYGKTGVYFR